MTRTVFHLTSDGGDTSFPDADATKGIDVGSAAQDISRYSIVGQGPFQYPLNNDGFNVPYMRFIILDASGSKINTAPRISLKLPNSFNLSNFSDYSKTDQIFGGKEEFKNATTGKTTTDASKGDSGFNASTYTQAAGDALRYTLEKGLTNVLGFISSAGIGNASQYEFLNRRAINPQSQLLYKGPQYRKYQIPVTMRPRNQKEADNCAAIIKIFRLASSPTVPGSLIGGSPNDDSTSVLGAGSSFTFGYPHLVQFNINFQQVKTVSRQGGTIQVLYRSKVCAIDSVSVDYGGQKMTFFEDGKPTEMNLTIQLTEITPRTVGDAKNDARSSDSTFA